MSPIYSHLLGFKDVPKQLKMRIKKVLSNHLLFTLNHAHTSKRPPSGFEEAERKLENFKEKSPQLQVQR